MGGCTPCLSERCTGKALPASPDTQAGRSLSALARGSCGGKGDWAVALAAAAVAAAAAAAAVAFAAATATAAPGERGSGERTVCSTAAGDLGCAAVGEVGEAVKSKDSASRNPRPPPEFTAAAAVAAVAGREGCAEGEMGGIFSLGCAAVAKGDAVVCRKDSASRNPRPVLAAAAWVAAAVAVKGGGAEGEVGESWPLPGPGERCRG